VGGLGELVNGLMLQRGPAGAGPLLCPMPCYSSTKWAETPMQIQGDLTQNRIQDTAPCFDFDDCFSKLNR
jgi:hypothetical protein